MENVKGFTLIELILYIALSSIVMMSALSFLFLMIDGRDRAQIMAEVEQQGQFVASFLTKTIRESEEIIEPASGNSDVTLELTKDTLPVLIDVDEERLRITVADDDPKYLTGQNLRVENFTVENFTPTRSTGVIKISFRLIHASSDDGYARDFTFTASVR